MIYYYNKGYYLCLFVSRQDCLFVLLCKVDDVFCNHFLLFLTQKSYHGTNPNYCHHLVTMARQAMVPGMNVYTYSE